MLTFCQQRSSITVKANSILYAVTGKIDVKLVIERGSSSRLDLVTESLTCTVTLSHRVSAESW